MLSCISSFDGAMEGFYHGMMLGLAAGMSSKYFIRSNREAGEGRFDLALEPKSFSMPCILMEFKATKDEHALCQTAERALEQIREKQYDVEFRSRGFSDIAKYGIAFCGKNVEIVME